MVRTGLKKSRGGCQRCKERKVKCDEDRPQCKACARHQVLCEYTDPPPRKVPKSQPSAEQATTAPTPNTDNTLELRLMHQWTAHTCLTFSVAWPFWRTYVPLVGLKHRRVLDAAFALTALHLAKVTAGTMPKSAQVEQDDQGQENPQALQALMPDDDLDEFKRHADDYFARALAKHEQHMAAFTFGDAQVMVSGAFLLSLFALCTLDDEETNLLRWMRLGADLRKCYLFYVGSIREGRCQTFESAFKHFDGTSADDEFLYDVLNPFANLLTFAADEETITIEDKAAYKRAIAFAATDMRSVTFGQAVPLEIAQHIMLFPALLPERFTVLVEQGRPRALAIMAHVFANATMLAHEVPWLRGIAAVQIGKIAKELPEKWQERLSWPMMLLEGEISRMPRQERDETRLPPHGFRLAEAS